MLVSALPFAVIVNPKIGDPVMRHDHVLRRFAGADARDFGNAQFGRLHIFPVGTFQFPDSFFVGWPALSEGRPALRKRTTATTVIIMGFLFPRGLSDIATLTRQLRMLSALEKGCNQRPRELAACRESFARAACEP